MSKNVNFIIFHLFKKKIIQNQLELILAQN